MCNIVELIGVPKLKTDLEMDEEQVHYLIDNHMPIPMTDEQKQFVEKTD